MLDSKKKFDRENSSEFVSRASYSFLSKPNGRLDGAKLVRSSASSISSLASIASSASPTTGKGSPTSLTSVTSSSSSGTPNRAGSMEPYYTMTPCVTRSDSVQSIQEFSDNSTKSVTNNNLHQLINIDINSMTLEVQTDGLKSYLATTNDLLLNKENKKKHIQSLQFILKETIVLRNPEKNREQKEIPNVVENVESSSTKVAIVQRSFKSMLCVRD